MRSLRLILALSLAACDAPGRAPPPPTVDMTLDVDATLVGLSTAVTRLGAEVTDLRELQRHLAICLDASYDLQTVRRCGRRYRWEEKGWGSDE